MPKKPPTTDEVLRTVRVTTPPEWHEPALDKTDAQGNPVATEQGQILRGNARNLSELAKVIGRGASRQFFVTPPDFEPASFGSRAGMTLEITRTRDLDEVLVLQQGSISLVGPRERVYRSLTDVVWYGNDPDGEIRFVDLECELIGEPGNLDFDADANGLLTIPGVDPPEPDTDLVDFVNSSQNRAGQQGVLEVTPVGLSQLTDDGAAPTFSPSDPGLYLEITFAGNLANIGRILRIVGYQVGTVPAGNLFPRTVILDDGPIADLILAAQLDDGGVFTVLTTEARSSDLNDVPLLPAASVVGDAFYFGALAIPSFVDIDLAVAMVADLELTWESWDGATWQPLVDVIDETETLAVAGLRRVSWTLPALWPASTINGVDAVWARARVTSFTSQATQPIASRLFMGVADPLLADPLDANGDGQISWTILDAEDLGVEILSMTAPADGRDDDLGLKIRERQVLQREGESANALRRRSSRFANVVSPTLIEREINQILNPFGVAGKIIDPGDGFIGLFWDTPTSFAPGTVGAWDLYDPGDIFPVDPTMLPISIEDSRWHFDVCVPPPTLGEYGAAWDQGPTPQFVEAFGEFIDSAWDYAFTDGSPFVSEALYKQVFDRVNEIKGGGISFSVIQCDVPSCP